MLTSHFGIQRHPFDQDGLQLLPHQQETLDILLVHSQQGGLCLLLGEPGSGKSTLKEALCRHDPKRLVTPLVNRTLHTYHNTLRILCTAFTIEFSGRDHHCERQLVAEAFRLHRTGKMLAPIIYDAHLMPGECLRKIRLLCEDFPRTHTTGAGDGSGEIPRSGTRRARLCGSRASQLISRAYRSTSVASDPSARYQ